MSTHQDLWICEKVIFTILFSPALPLFSPLGSLMALPHCKAKRTATRTSAAYDDFANKASRAFRSCWKFWIWLLSNEGKHGNHVRMLFLWILANWQRTYIEIWVSVCILGWAMLSCIVHHQPSHPLFGLTPSSQQRSKGQEGHAWHGQQRGRVCRRPARHYEA